jgi:hypothetical protein
VFESTDGGVTWTNIDNNFPDVPGNSIRVLPGGELIVGTDLAVLYRAANSTTWKRLGTGLPLTVAIDVEQGAGRTVAESGASPRRRHTQRSGGSARAVLALQTVAISSPDRQQSSGRRQMWSAG